MNTQTILVTGASSGFGRLTAEALARAGHTVFATMRDVAGRNAGNAQAMQELKAERGLDLRVVELDVQSQQSVDAAVAAVIEQAGRIDVVIHNAGHMMFGPAEAFTPEQFAQLYDSNVLGTQRVNRAVLPHMRSRRSGLVVWVSSSSSAGGTPPIWRPTSPPRLRWTRLRCSTPVSWRCGASRLRSSFRARSPTAPTTSRTPARRQTRP